MDLIWFNPATADLRLESFSAEAAIGVVEGSRRFEGCNKVAVTCGEKKRKKIEKVKRSVRVRDSGLVVVKYTERGCGGGACRNSDRSKTAP